jgi:hypothetical protein
MQRSENARHDGSHEDEGGTDCGDVHLGREIDSGNQVHARLPVWTSAEAASLEKTPSDDGGSFQQNLTEA